MDGASCDAMEGRLRMLPSFDFPAGSASPLPADLLVLFAGDSAESLPAPAAAPASSAVLAGAAALGPAVAFADLLVPPNSPPVTPRPAPATGDAASSPVEASPVPPPLRQRYTSRLTPAPTVPSAPAFAAATAEPGAPVDGLPLALKAQPGAPTQPPAADSPAPAEALPLARPPEESPPTSRAAIEPEWRGYSPSGRFVKPEPHGSARTALSRADVKPSEPAPAAVPATVPEPATLPVSATIHGPALVPATAAAALAESASRPSVPAPAQSGPRSQALPRSAAFARVGVEARLPPVASASTATPVASSPAPFASPPNAPAATASGMSVPPAPPPAAPPPSSAPESSARPELDPPPATPEADLPPGPARLPPRTPGTVNVPVPAAVAQLVVSPVGPATAAPTPAAPGPLASFPLAAQIAAPVSAAVSRSVITNPKNFLNLSEEILNESKTIVGTQGASTLGMMSAVPVASFDSFLREPAAAATAWAREMAERVSRVVETLAGAPGRGESVRIDVPVEGHAAVQVQVSLRAGQVHAVVRAATPELQNALQDAWNQFRATAEGAAPRAWAEPLFLAPAPAAAPAATLPSVIARAAPAPGVIDPSPAPAGDRSVDARAAGDEPSSQDQSRREAASPPPVFAPRIRSGATAVAPGRPVALPVASRLLSTHA